jgi:cytidylate kinase
VVRDDNSPAPSGSTGQLVITISAPYGTGGSVVAPALAERLGVPFLQRVTGSTGDAVASPARGERLSVHEVRHTPVHRFVAALTQTMPCGPTQSPLPTHHQDEDLRRRGEAEIGNFLVSGGGVILGHAAAVVLGKARGYHVRLEGAPERRLVQGSTIEGIDLDEARAHMRAADAARTGYVRRLYRVDPADASLYHLVIDSTVLPFDDVVEMIARGATRAQSASGGEPKPSPAPHASQ